MLIIWIGICIACIALEILTPSALISVWFALGAFLACLATFLGLSLEWQIVIFVITSLAALFVVRPMATKYLRGNIIATNADRVIGEIGVVTKSIIENKWGEVFIQSTYWSAIEVEGKTVEKGNKVKVLAIEGAKLIVKEI